MASMLQSVTLGSLIVYVVYCILYALYNLYLHPLSKFPGPASRAAFYFPDVWVSLKGISHLSTKRLHDEYGSVVRIYPNALSFITADAWKDIYGAKPDKRQLVKDLMIMSAGEVTNIIVADQPDHARFRKLLAYGLSDTALREQEPLLTQYFDLLISRLKDQIEGPSKGKVDILSWLNFTTFDIIGDLVYGEPFDGLKTGQYHPWIILIFSSIKFMDAVRVAKTYAVFGLLLDFLMRVVPSFADGRKAYLDLAYDRTEARLKRKTDRKDITNYILRYNDSNGMSHDEICVNSGVLITGGSETTGALLSGMLYHLQCNPNALTRVQNEVRSMFKSEEDIIKHPPGGRVGQAPPLPYLEAVLQESLRIYPPVPSSFSRITGPQGDTIDGHFVPPGISVGVPQYSTNHSRSNFAQPEKFIPERWLADAPVEFRDDVKAAMQPFGTGPRNCLGKSLAWFEMRSIAARLLWHFDMQICEESLGWEAAQRSHLLWEKVPLWMRLEIRKGT